MADNNLQALYNGFRRLKDFPLDPSCIFETKEDLNTYVGTEKSTAYPGQVVVVLNNDDNGEGKGVYYIESKSGENNAQGVYTRVIDKDDYNELENGFDDLKEALQLFESQTGQNFNDLYNRITDEFLSLEEWEEVTKLDKTEVEGAIDTLKEVFLILDNINNTFLKSPAFEELNNKIEKIKALIPAVNFGSGKASDFIPNENEFLVTTGKLNDVKKFVAHSERVAHFSFGAGLENRSEILGKNLGKDDENLHREDDYIITEIRIDIDNPASGDVKGFAIVEEGKDKPVMNVIRVSHSNRPLVNADEIDFTETSTYSFEGQWLVTQESSVDCDHVDFKGAHGTIYIKYFNANYFE